MLKQLLARVLSLFFPIVDFSGIYAALARWIAAVNETASDQQVSLTT